MSQCFAIASIPIPTLTFNCQKIHLNYLTHTVHTHTLCLIHLLFALISGDVSVGIKCDGHVISDSKEVDVEFDIIPNANDTFTVKYVPPSPGTVTVRVLFTEQVPEHFNSYFGTFLV